MSRKIDMDNLSDDDKIYLAQRGQLPESVASIAEQREMLTAEPAPLDAVANTGTVNTANLSVEELEALLKKARAAAKVDPKTLMKKPAAEAALAEEEEEGLEPPYDQYTKGQLYAEIARRNEGRADEDIIEIEPPGNKANYVEALAGDDEEEPAEELEELGEE